MNLNILFPMRARLVVVDEKAKQAVTPIEAQGKFITSNTDESGTLPGSKQQAAQFEAVARGSEDLAAILYTSGTTGRFKGQLCHRNLLSTQCVA